MTTAVNLGAPLPEARGAVRALCSNLGALAQGLARWAVDRVELEVRGRIAEHDTRVLGIAVLAGILRGHTEEQVNLVNAGAIAEERGIELTEITDAVSEDFTELLTVARRRMARTRSRSREPASARATIPYLVGAWGQSFYMPLAEHLAIFRYADQPGMIGRVGTAFGEHGVNIVSAAVGAEAGRRGRDGLTTDAPVPHEVIDEIAGEDGFFAGRAVEL